MSDLGQPFLYIDASCLIDPRFFEALASASKTTIVHMDPADADRCVVRAGFFNKKDLETWVAQGAASLIRTADALYPDDLDPFRSEIRGAVKPYFLEIRTKESARNATRLLIEKQQKQESIYHV